MRLIYPLMWARPDRKADREQAVATAAALARNGVEVTLVLPRAEGDPALGAEDLRAWFDVEGETGFIVPERDAEALAARLMTILADRERRSRMGAAARALAERKFDFAAQMRRLEEIYDQVRAGGCG